MVFSATLLRSEWMGKSSMLKVRTYVRTLTLAQDDKESDVLAAM